MNYERNANENPSEIPPTSSSGHQKAAGQWFRGQRTTTATLFLGKYVNTAVSHGKHVPQETKNKNHMLHQPHSRSTPEKIKSVC